MASLIISEYDVIIVGSGAAGSAAARAAADAGANVLLISKDPLNASDTKIAEGIVTVMGSGDTSDTAKALSLNLRLGGSDISDPALTDAFAGDSQAAYDWLTETDLISGLSQHDGTPDALPLALGGHDRTRSVDHKNGGLDYAHALWRAIHRRDDIDTLEDCWAIDLLVDRTGDTPNIQGLLAYHAATGTFLAFAAPSVVLACGGASSLYFPCTDTMRNNTGDAYGMALRAGARLVDMEQVQFLPFGITAPRAFEGLLAGEPVSCGPLGVLRDRAGKIILSELMVRTRADCAAAIARAVADGRGTENGGCWLDLTGNIEGAAGPLFLELMQARTHSMLSVIKKAMGPKAARYEDWWEVRPTAHYFMGGLWVDAEGGADLPGLYAAGQAMGGLHGANRLGSTSLAEGAIFGLRAGRAAARFAEAHKVDEGAVTVEATRYLDPLAALLQRKAGGSPLPIQKALQTAAFDAIGPARSGAAMSTFRAHLEDLRHQLNAVSCEGPKIWNQTFLDYLDTRNLLICADAIAAAGIERSTSLGAHVRVDATKAPRRNAYSVLTAQTMQGPLVSKPLPRPASPFAKRLSFRLGERARQGRLKVLRHLPAKLRERVLIRTYSKLLGRDVEATAS